MLTAVTTETAIPERSLSPDINYSKSTPSNQDSAVGIDTKALEFLRARMLPTVKPDSTIPDTTTPPPITTASLSPLSDRADHIKRTYGEYGCEAISS